MVYTSRTRTRRLGLPSGSSIHTLFVPVLAVLVLLGACSEPEAPQRPPLELPVVQVVQRDQPIVLEMVGQTQGSSDVPIRARVDGFLDGIHFVEGRNVKKGDLLYTIDEVPFETDIVEAEGLLAEAQTNLAKSKSDLARIRPLAEMNAISLMDLDAAVATHEAAMGAVQSAKAQVKQAQIIKGYCRIYSPIDGRIGLSEVEVGEYVGRTGSSLLNLVSQVDPIRVRFSIDEKNYLALARKFSEASESGNKQSGVNEIDELTLVLADGSVHLYPGYIVSTDATIDHTTGTFTLEADFPNPKGLVLAGQYARVISTAEVRQNALLVPQRSITELQGDFSVFTVDAQGKVEQRAVEIGPKIDRLQIITSGLKPSEKVVLEGVQKLRNGMIIRPHLTDFSDAAGSPSASTTRG